MRVCTALVRWQPIEIKALNPSYREIESFRRAPPTDAGLDGPGRRALALEGALGTLAAIAVPNVSDATNRRIAERKFGWDCFIKVPLGWLMMLQKSHASDAA